MSAPLYELHGNVRLKGNTAGPWPIDEARGNGTGWQYFVNGTWYREADLEPLTKTTQWDWHDITEAYQPRPPKIWLIGNLLKVPSLNLIVGAPGSMKTYIAMDQALSVATGQDWLPPLPGQPGTAQAVTQAPVLWVDVDNGLDELLDRWEALARGHGIWGSPAPLKFISFPVPAFIAGDTASIDRLTQEALTHGAKLIVIDNLGTVSGGADENSPEMIQVMSGLRQVSEFARAAVLCVHHRNKNGEGQNAIRGSTSIAAAADLALLAERNGTDDVVSMFSVKSRGAVVEPFTALFEYHQDPIDSRRLNDARFVDGGPPDTSKLSPGKQAEMWIRQNWGTELTDGMNQSEIADAVKQATKIGSVTIRAAVRSLVARGYLTERKGAHNACDYYATLLITH